MYSDQYIHSIILPFSCQRIPFDGKNENLPILSNDNIIGVTVTPIIKLKHPNKKDFFNNEPQIYEHLQNLAISIATKNDRHWAPYNNGIAFNQLTSDFKWKDREEIIIDNQFFMKIRPYGYNGYDVLVPVFENFRRTLKVKAYVINLLSMVNAFNILDVIDDECSSWRIIPTAPAWKIQNEISLHIHDFILYIDGHSINHNDLDSTILYGNVIIKLNDISLNKKIPLPTSGKCMKTILLQWRLNLVILYFTLNKGKIKRVRIGGGTYGGVYKNEGEFGIVRKKAVYGKEKQALNEIRISNMFNHPNIIKLVGVEYQQDGFEILFPKYEMDCYNYIRLNSDVELKISFSFTRDLFSALVEIHRLNIIHRDIKPNNCFVNLNPPILVLGDFGQAVEVSKLPDNVAPGIDRCRAPETFIYKEYDAKIDVYAAALCVVLELFTRKDKYDYRSIDESQLYSDMDVYIPDFHFWIEPKLEDRYTSKQCYDQIIKLLFSI